MRAPLHLVLSISVVASIAPQARAQSVEEFYRGKTIDVTVPGSAGGDYDLRARMVARHMGRHIPGKPAMVVRNMPGGIGIQAGNHLANSAPKDGTVMTIVFQNMPVLQAIGQTGIQFDTRRFNWIGNTTDGPNVLNSWHTTGITKFEDVLTKELVVGASGTGSSAYTYPAAMNQLLGTKFKIVGGYPGGNEINLAMERGESMGRYNTWSAWKVTKPDWIAERKIVMLVQSALRKPKDLQDAPLLADLARSNDDRRIFELLATAAELGRPLVASPDIPADRLAALNAAYRAMLSDPEFVAEAAQLKIEIAPLVGAELQDLVARALATPKPLTDRLKKLVE